MSCPRLIGTVLRGIEMTCEFPSSLAFAENRLHPYHWPAHRNPYHPAISHTFFNFWYVTCRFPRHIRWVPRLLSPQSQGIEMACEYPCPTYRAALRLMAEACYLVETSKSTLAENAVSVRVHQAVMHFGSSQKHAVATGFETHGVVSVRHLGIG